MAEEWSLSASSAGSVLLFLGMCGRDYDISLAGLISMALAGGICGY